MAYQRKTIDLLIKRLSPDAVVPHITMKVKMLQWI